MVPSSIGQKPRKKTHSFISNERDANTGLRSLQRVVGKRNASSFFQGSNFRPLKIRFKSFPDHTPTVPPQLQPGSAPLEGLNVVSELIIPSNFEIFI